MQTQPPPDTQDKSAATDAAAAPLTDSISVLITVSPATLARFGIAPDAMSKDDIAAKLSVALETPAPAAQGDGKAAELQAQLDAANAQLATATAKIAEMESAALADDLAEQLDGCGLDDAAIAAIAALSAEQRDTMIALFKQQAAKPAPAAAAPATEAKPAEAKPAPAAAAEAKTPPAPIHSTSAQSAPSAEAKAKEAEAMIAAIRKEPHSKFPDYTSARAEARRRKPELFA